MKLRTSMLCLDEEKKEKYCAENNIDKMFSLILLKRKNFLNGAKVN